MKEMILALLKILSISFRVIKEVMMMNKTGLVRMKMKTVRKKAALYLID